MEDYCLDLNQGSGKYSNVHLQHQKHIVADNTQLRGPCESQHFHIQQGLSSWDPLLTLEKQVTLWRAQ